jgi:hypothetical protein
MKDNQPLPPAPKDVLQDPVARKFWLLVNKCPRPDMLLVTMAEMDQFQDVLTKQNKLIADLRNALELTQKDAARLDWLEKTQTSVEAWTSDDQNGEPTRQFYQCDVVGIDKARLSIRDAIDVAMDHLLANH